jgi:hypothetical protein
MAPAAPVQAEVRGCAPLLTMIPQSAVRVCVGLAQVAAEYAL